MKNITILVAVVLLISFVLPDDVFAQSVNNSTESLNAKIESLLKTIAQMREQVGQLQQKKVSVGVSQNDTNDSSTISSTDNGNQGLCGIGPIVRDIRVGDSDSKLNKGDIVHSVQEYLRSEGYFTYPTSTGYFGSITESALKKWQKANNISSSESGRIGLESLKRIQKSRCLPMPPIPSPEAYMNLNKSVYNPGETVTVTLSYSNKSSSEQKVLNFNSGCHVYVTAMTGYFAQSNNIIKVSPWSYDSRNTEMCTQQQTTVTIGAGEIKTWTKTFVLPSDARGSLSVSGGFYGDTIKTTFGTVYASIKPTDTEKKSIAISAIEGPNSLGVGQIGTWRVYVTAMPNTQLKYLVRWGDEPKMVSLENIGLSEHNVIKSYAEFRYTYSRAGIYEILFTVKDANNPNIYAESKMSINVNAIKIDDGGLIMR